MRYGSKAWLSHYTTKRYNLIWRVAGRDDHTDNFKTWLGNVSTQRFSTYQQQIYNSMK
jgi:hypothetical protein